MKETSKVARLLGQLLLFALGGTIASAQPSRTESFTSHNKMMAAEQPSWITPLVEADPRLVQYVRFSTSKEYTPARTETTNYGNLRGGGVIVGKRYEFDLCPPSYIQHNGAASDGMTDMSSLVKYRISSGNADHGNYIVTAMLSHTLATGSYKNGALTNSFTPTVAGGVGINRRVQVESSIGGLLPTGKIATQGRTILWNALVQVHATTYLWGEIENNASFYFSGSHDGKQQNFVTPALFYVLRKKEWSSTHPFFVVDGGMQVATSQFHNYNHNLISEVRMLF